MAVAGVCMIDTIIFDMDGVLINSEPLHKSINQEYFRQLGVPVSNEEYSQNFVGLPLEQICVRLREKHTLNSSVEGMLKEIRQRIYKGFEQATLEPIHGINMLLSILTEMKLNLAVGSSSSPELISLILSRLGLKDFFLHFISGDEVERGKPFPDLFLHISRLLKTKPEYCLVIEDSSVGVRAALRAGMKVIGVKNPSSGAQKLKQADFVIPDFQSQERKRIIDFICQPHC
jgi:HAD superfamily hydrolase (TIGR01509 family)